jgi:drug/metabolite transporter (DMT)-like permease
MHNSLRFGNFQILLHPIAPSRNFPEPTMTASDLWLLIHPALAVAFVFPLIGVICYFAWQTRERRLQNQGGKSKIPPMVGPEHVKLGRWLSGSVVALVLIGLIHPIFSKMHKAQAWSETPGRAAIITILFGATIAAFICLYRAKPKQKYWRSIFATLTGMGMVILGAQPEVFRRTHEWYVSHYYLGMAAALLMVFSLATVPEIYRDRSQRWRKTHALLNSFATLLFIAQGFTGVRDLLEIPLSWQGPFIYQNCDYAAQICPAPDSAS